MNISFKFCSLALIIFAVTTGYAQHRGMMRRGDGENPERLQRFRMMRLVQSLDLSEEESVRFFAKQNAHEETRRNLMKERNNVLDEMKDAAKSKPDGKDIQKNIDRVLESDQKMFDERKRFQKELREFLSADKFARYLVFERNFGTKLREAMQQRNEMQRDRDNE